MRTALFLSICLFTSQTAIARPNVSVEFGPVYAAPTGRGEDRMGGALRLGVAGELAPQHVIGGRVQAGMYNNAESALAHDAWTLFGFYRYLLSDPTIAPFAGASLGAGYWNGCVNGDSCGGIGLAAGVEVGVFLRATENMKFTFSAELASIFNLPNRVGNMMMPAIQAGVYF